MKKILVSLFLVSVVASLGVMASLAFFSDQETSSNNTFQAGAIDLKIGNESFYNGNPSDHTSWTLSDLTDQVFFSFTDLKPGDLSEDTVTLEVETNEAWVCVSVELTKSAENDITEPESKDDSNLNNGDWDGELDEELHFVFWADDGDNVLETGETLLGPFSASNLPQNTQDNVFNLALVDSQTNIFGNTLEPFPGNTPKHLGKAWCFGNLVIDPSADRGVACDPTGLTNRSQTDSLIGNITFLAIQARHNDNYLCPIGQTPTPTPTTSPTPTPTPDPGEPFVDEVTNISGTFGNPVTLPSSLGDANTKVSGPNDGQFVQLSNNTVLVAHFVNNKAVDGPGADIRIHTIDALFPGEATIELSSDGVTYVSAGNFFDTSNVDIDISGLLSEVKYIRFTDLVDAGEEYPDLGFDLDAIEALNSVAVF